MIGVAITSVDKVLAKGEIELRDDVSEEIKARSIMRRTRRNRKTRYRQPRFLNRKRKLGWLPPSVQAKLNATLQWIDTFNTLVPKCILSIEVAKFDIAKIVNPEICGKGYQDGQAKDYYNIRYFVFARDKYTCQLCRKKNRILRTHHIVFESCGGTNRADNLITLCTDCHTSENHKPGGILYEWMTKRKRTRQYKDPTFMNIVRKRILNIYPNARITYGSETSLRRKELGLDKSHYNDAIAVSDIKTIKYNPPNHFYYKQFRKKKRSLHESIPRKGLSAKNTMQKRSIKNVKYRNGTYLNDKVQCRDLIGWVYGFSGGERGYQVILRDIYGNIVKANEGKNAIHINMKKANILCHNNGWQYMLCA
jgi:hypothetical protein